MRFLKITNRGTVHRKRLEILGFTTKRDKMDDSSIVGNKGTEIKLCIPASLRLGMIIFVCSSDDRGSYILGYEQKKISVDGDEINQLFFSYVGGELVPSQMLLESFLDWDKPIGADTTNEFKIVRGLIANAKDADPDFRIQSVEYRGDGYSISENGETSVFVTETDGVREIVFVHPERYIKFLSKHQPLITVSGKGKLYPKSSPETRIFLQDFLLECKASKDITSLFDYSLLDKSLTTEERTVKSYYLLHYRIGELIFALDSPEIAKIILENIPQGLAQLEIKAMNQLAEIPTAAKEIFRAAWESSHSAGTQAVLASGSVPLDEQARADGYEVVSVNHSDLRQFLVKCGVKQVTDVISNDVASIVEVILTAEEQAIFVLAHELFLYFRPEAGKIPVRFFASSDERLRWDGFAGKGENIFGEIWVSRSAIAKGAKNVLETLIHEFRHCSSRAKDYTLQFELRADADEADLMLRFAPPEILEKINPR